MGSGGDSMGKELAAQAKGAEFWSPELLQMLPRHGWLAELATEACPEFD